MIAAIVLVLGLTAASAQTFNGGDSAWYCNIIGKENCITHTRHPKCGTDGITYRNMCALGKAHCADNSVDQKHDGPCTSSESTVSSTTMSPDQIIHGSEIILQFQCALLSQQPCTHSINEKICATDGITYEDFCEYEKARCTHHTLHVQNLGDCTS